MKKNMLVGTGIAAAAVALAMMVGTPAVAASPQQGIVGCGRVAVECALGRAKAACEGRGLSFVDADGDGTCDNAGPCTNTCTNTNARARGHHGRR